MKAKEPPGVETRKDARGAFLGTYTPPKIFPNIR